MKFGLAHPAALGRTYTGAQAPLPTATLPGGFRQQTYTRQAPPTLCHSIAPPALPAAGSREFKRRMLAVGELLRAADVAAIYLVHGQFAGLECASLLQTLARLCPQYGAAMREVARRMSVTSSRDAGHYTPHYAELFAEAICGAAEPIPVRVFSWSGENHHLGRADAAVRLIDELASLELAPRRRILLWAHGQAGNVLALVSNLLSGHVASVEQFFAAARVYYQVPLAGVVDIPVWRRVYRLLVHNPWRLGGRPLGFVTFGTPVAYAWERRGYDSLLHVVHHRPAPGVPPHLAAFPPDWEDNHAGTGGDFIQQLGVAGTSGAPNVTACRAWLADRRLRRLLEGDLADAEPTERLQLGVRVHEAGTTLLVDYGPTAGSPAEHLAGHAIYTRPEWLLFHAELVAQRFYAGSVAARDAA